MIFDSVFFSGGRSNFVLSIWIRVFECMNERLYQAFKSKTHNEKSPSWSMPKKKTHTHTMIIMTQWFWFHSFPFNILTSWRFWRWLCHLSDIQYRLNSTHWRWKHIGIMSLWPYWSCYDTLLCIFLYSFHFYFTSFFLAFFSSKILYRNKFNSKRFQLIILHLCTWELYC